ncbi:ribonuclease H-like domain-containing protein [Tanacetum coccineum]
MTDYSIWEVILNGNKVLKRQVRETKQEYEPTTAKEKQDMRNEMKDRGTLLMALPNKDQLKFHSYKDVKMLMEAIEKRYGGNKESKKVQRTLLKQQYENFAGSSSEIMDQTNDRLQKLINNLSDVEMAMLSIKARRFTKRIGRKLDINGQRIRFDRSKVECYNCLKNGHIARECRAPRNQENRGRENGKRTVTVETPTENALISQDGIRGYDWSYQAEEEHPTNFALMAYTSSGSSSNSDSEVDSCSKTCVKAYATLKEQYDSLNSDYNKSQFNLVSYKADSQVSDKFKTGLGYNAASSTTASPAVESFVNSSEVLENQEYNKSKSDKGYHAVPPPYTENFIPSKPDLMFMDEIVESENVDAITVITPSDVKKVETNHESADKKIRVMQ